MKYYLIILILITNLSSAQNERDSILRSYIYQDISRLNLIKHESIAVEKTYRIWNGYQVLELKKINDSLFEGHLINFVTEKLKKGKSKTIYQKIKIPSPKVQTLLLELYKNKIESLPDCTEIKNYPKGFDGTSYTFEIFTKDHSRIYSYWEPENVSYQDPSMEEIKYVRAILKAINKEFDLWKQFEFFRDRLPIGSYSYGGINMVRFR